MRLWYAAQFLGLLWGGGMLVLFIAAALNLIDERRKRQSLRSDKVRKGNDKDQ